MDYNGNSISENPFFKHDGANKRLFRRRPIVIRDTDSKRTDCGLTLKMKNPGDPNDVLSISQSLNGDLEYGPGIVEKLRAKFSRMSGAQKSAAETIESKSFHAQAKKFSSCDDLLSEDDRNLKPNQFSNQMQKPLARRTSRSISDMMGCEEFEKVPDLPKAGEQENAVSNTEVKSIVQLCRRFEKNGEQAAKMRFARDPMKLIAKVYPEQQQTLISPPPLSSAQVYKKTENVKTTSPATSSYTSQFIQNSTKTIAAPPRPVELPKAANVLKVLNDAKSESGEPEFVQIARRLRRYQPEIFDKTEDIEPSIENETRLPETTARPASNAKWSRRQPDIPNLTNNAKVIRETCDISAVLPQDPHSARVSKQQIPSITTNLERTNVPIEASPPPEEPKPNNIDTFSQYRKPVMEINSDNRSNLANSVFKYENPPQRSTSITTTTNSWKLNNETNKIPSFGRKVEDISSKSIITSQSTNSPNVVSITVKGPTSNRIYSNYEKSDDSSSEMSSSSSIRSNNPVKPPTTYSPSYISTSYAKPTSLSSKYVEEKSKDNNLPVNSSLTEMLSPREKPYGDDVTILKSFHDASNKPVANAEPTADHSVSDEDQSEDGSSTDDDSHDGTGSYDVTPLRPNSLIFTRLANENSVGGDGNMISRSLISLIAEEDLPDFLVSLNEKPVNYVIVQNETETASTSSILRPRDSKKSEKMKTSSRIRFCTESPMAYAYLDEVTATRSIQWEDGEIVDYSYFKELEEQEYINSDPSLVLLEIEKQLAQSDLNRGQPDTSFAEAVLMESALNSAY